MNKIYNPNEDAFTTFDEEIEPTCQCCDKKVRSDGDVCEDCYEKEVSE